MSVWHCCRLHMNRDSYMPDEKILDPFAISLMGPQAKNSVLPKQAKTWGDRPLRSRCCSKHTTAWHECQAVAQKGTWARLRITIRRGSENLQTHTDILTFNKSIIPKEIKIGYYLEKVEQYIPIPLRCFKCQKYGNYLERCRGHLTCGRWG